MSVNVTTFSKSAVANNAVVLAFAVIVTVYAFAKESFVIYFKVIVSDSKSIFKSSLSNNGPVKTAGEPPS